MQQQQKHNKPGCIQLDGLPISVIDYFDVWARLCVNPTIPLGRLDWMWLSDGHSIRESSSSAHGSFQVNNSLSVTTSAPSSEQEDDDKQSQLRKSQTLAPLYKDSYHWYLNPYIYIFVVSVEQLDKSGSANDAWNRLRFFVEQCRELKYEHIVVCLGFEGDEAQQQKQKKIFDKLGSEVNQPSKTVDRVVTISLPEKNKSDSATKDVQDTLLTSLHHSPTHRDFLLRIREFIRGSVQVRIQQYEDELKRVYGQSKSDADWSLTSFLLIKEGLSVVFSHLGRRDIAVKHYEHVYSMLVDHAVPYTSFCDLSPSQAAQELSNVSARDYHSMLHNSKISELDLYTYLHKQQFALLLADRKYTQVAEKGVKFIAYIQKRCNEIIAAGTSSSTSPPITVVFRDVWVFTTARIFSSLLAPVAPSPSNDDNNSATQLTSSRERHAVRLVAGFHVQALKALQNLAQIVIPGCLSADPPRITNDAQRKELTKQAMKTADDKLRKALSSPKAAEKLYSEMANAAASLYEMGLRARGAAALDGDAGNVHLMNKSYSEAENLLTAQCSRFMNDPGWDMLHRRQRANLAQAEKNLNRTQEYLVSCLTMLSLSRTSRLLTPVSQMASEEVAKMEKDALFWVTETVQTAFSLPRVLRYKVERLFNLSVLPNKEPWEDGSHASATVRIKSDILADFTLDYILLECKCMDVPSLHKSALHHREDEPSKQGSAASAGIGPESRTSSSSSTSAIVKTTDAPDVFVLKSENSIVLKPGITDVRVSANEVPHHGQYRVNLISLYVGQLKFVYTASKVGNNPIAIVHENAGSKSALSSLPTSPLVDFAVFEAHTPLFYASRRTPSAKLRYSEQKPLYLVPRARQSVTLKISAGEKGIAPGARLVCSLSERSDDINRTNNGVSSPKPFVQFYKGNGESSAQVIEDGDSALTLVLQRPKNSELDDNMLDLGEILLNRELRSGEVLLARIELEVMNDNAMPESGEMKVSQQCKLISQIRWCELGNRNGRRFSTHVVTNLTFESPIDISTYLELHHEQNAGIGSNGIGYDGTPLADGGTLLCCLAACTTNDLSIDIKQVSLETPSWLELRSDEDAPHTSLLPCTLHARSELVCAFDVFVRREEDKLPMDGGRRDETAKQNVEDTLKMRLSRRTGRYINNNMMDVLREDSQEPVDHKIDHGGKDVSPSSLLDQSISSPKKSASPRYANRVIPSGEDSSQPSTTSTRKDDDDDNKPRSSITPRNDDKDPRNKPATDLVDLSSEDNLFSEQVMGQVGGLEGKGKDVLSEVERQEEQLLTARLAIELRIPGVVDWTMVERAVSMKAMQRAGLKRYGMSRGIAHVGQVGHVLDMTVHVWSVGDGGGAGPGVSRGADGTVGMELGGQATEKIHYEVVFDPAAWIVVGQQRGVMNVTPQVATALAVPGTAAHVIRLLPILGGRHPVPRIALFTEEATSGSGSGSGLRLTPLPQAQLEVVDEHMQIVVTPCREVVSACHGNEAIRVDDGDDNGIGGNMPIVVSSNMFFES